MRTIKFRGKRVDNGEWIFGDLLHDYWRPSIIYKTNDLHSFPIEVLPNTVGQLRHTNNHVEYYDGDIYRHAGYGNEVVSDLCQLQLALMSGEDRDIGEVIGNIHEGGEKLI